VAIEWGVVLNQHLVTQTRYTFSAEQWGQNTLYQLEVHIDFWHQWNQEVNGDTLEKTKKIPSPL
jgi:hypothetical protein